MNPLIPSKRSRTSVSVSLKHERRNFKDLNLLVKALVTGETLPEWIDVHTQGDLNVFLVFLPGCDLQLLQDFSDCLPFFQSVLADQNKWCRVETESHRGFLNDLISNYVPKQQDIQEGPCNVEDLILSPEQLDGNGFPSRRGLNFMSTDDQGSYKGILGIDCEMVKTTKGPELARVSLITDSGEILYDEFVIPEFPVLDYLTQFSGITPSLLNSATKTLELVQKDLKTLINSSSVLCGHSLENDLKSLKLIHTRVCDTSLLFPHKFAGRRLSLKSLSTQYLNRSIQTKGHNSVEDAQATLDLLKLKLKHGVSFGVPSCIFHESNLFKEISEKNAKSVVLGSFLPRDLVQGSLSVDLRGSLEKYVHGNFRLVVALFDALKKVDNENWDQEVEGILKKWDHDLKKVVQTVDNGIVVLMNGQGNVALAEK